MPGIRIDRLVVRMKGISRAEAEKLAARLPEEIQRHLGSALGGKTPVVESRIPWLRVDPFRTGPGGDAAAQIGSALAKSLAGRLEKNKGGGE